MDGTNRANQMKDEAFERRMLRLFTKEMKRLDGDKSPIDHYDTRLYRDSSFFACFMVRVRFAQLIKSIFR